MDEATQGISLLAQLFSLLAATGSAVLFTSLGIVLLGVGVWALYQIFNLKPDQQPAGWLRAIAFMSLVLGVVFSAIGPSIALIYLDNNPIRTVPKEEIYDRLEMNTRITWLIRLIPYDPNTQPHLSVGRLTKLGPPEIEYTFVAPYEELKGQTVEKAVEMVGGNLAAGNRVSAIIFSLGQDIIPANARGLLQIIKRVEGEKLTRSQSLSSL
jgi:hypothetical protein